MAQSFSPIFILFLEKSQSKQVESANVNIFHVPPPGQLNP